MKMKVVLANYLGVYPFHGIGGEEKYVYSLAKYLNRKNVQVEIVSSLNPHGGTQEDYNGVKYVFLPPRWDQSPISATRFSINLCKYLLGLDFDVLHSFTGASWLFQVLNSMRKNRVKTVIQPFGLDVFYSLPFMKARGLGRLKAEFVYRFPWRYVLSHSDVVATEGSFQHELMREFQVKDTQMFDLPQCVDLEYIDGILSEGGLDRKQIGLNEDDFVIICINRFHPERGQIYLVKAFYELKRIIPTAKLILIGKVGIESERDYFNTIIQLIKDYGIQTDVTIIRDASEEILYKYYYLSDLFVSPTLRDDPLLMSIQEAMACSLPVVSTGQKPLVKDGVNGYVITKRSPEAIFEAILKIYEGHKMKQFGKASRILVSQEYDYKSIADKAAELYLHL
jgi:glycosyltransferase involved in cell wall biosynthesis